MKTRSGRASTLIFLALILALSGSLLTRKFTAHFDGYLSYNEGWYSSVAVNYDAHSLWEPTRYDGRPDLNIPPLYSYLLRASYKVLGRREWSFRLVSVVMSLLCVAAVFFAGREIYGARAGLCAALLAGVSPILVLAGRNVQTDTTFLGLGLWGLYAFLRYRKTGRPAALMMSAALFGFALLAKQFAAISLAGLAAAVVIERRGALRLSLRSAAAALIAIAIPGQFYLYQIIHNTRALSDSTRYGAASTASFPAPAGVYTRVHQIYMGLDPAFFILLACAALAVVFRRRAPNLYVAIPLLFYFLFFLVLHKHDYYMLGVVPFGAIAAGRLLDGVKKPAVFAALIFVCAASGVAASMLTLGLQKYGYDRFAPMCAHIDSLPGNKTLVVEDALALRYQPTLYYYCRTAKIESESDFMKSVPPGGSARGDANNRYFFLKFDERLPAALKRNTKHYRRSSYGPCVLGRLFYYNPYEPGVKSSEKPDAAISTRRARPWCSLEMRKGKEIRSLALIELPEGWAASAGGRRSKDGKSCLRFAPAVHKDGD